MQELILFTSFFSSDYFFANDTGTPLQDNIVSVLEQLKLDKDRDVRYFAGGPYEPVRRRRQTLCEDEGGEEEVVEETDRPIHISGEKTVTIIPLLSLSDIPNSLNVNLFLGTPLQFRRV